jgi:hypothetical protein
MAAKKKKPTRLSKKVQQTEDLPPPRVLPFEIPLMAEEKPAWNEEGLTILQARFVEIFVGKGGGDATAAAEEAGYYAENRQALRNQAHRLMNLPHVSRAIQRRVAAQICSRKGQAIEEILQTLSLSDMRNFITVGEDGIPQMDFAKARDNAAIGQIREFRAEGITDGTGLRPFKVTVKLHDPRPALEILARIYGLLIDRKDITSDGKPITVKVLKGVSLDEL